MTTENILDENYWNGWEERCIGRILTMNCRWCKKKYKTKVANSGIKHWCSIKCCEKQRRDQKFA